MNTLLAQRRRSGNAHRRVLSLKIWMCKSDELAMCVHNMAASLAGGAGRRLGKNYKKLYDIMMQPPVGIQPRGAFRDTQFCCFLSIKLKSDVFHWICGIRLLMLTNQESWILKDQTTVCKSCLFYITAAHFTNWAVCLFVYVLKSWCLSGL